MPGAGIEPILSRTAPDTHPGRNWTVVAEAAPIPVHELVAGEQACDPAQDPKGIAAPQQPALVRGDLYPVTMLIVWVRVKKPIGA